VFFSLRGSGGQDSFSLLVENEVWRLCIGYPEELILPARPGAKMSGKGLCVRLIVSLILLAISTLSLTTGIVQRTVFEEPATVERTIQMDTSAPATIISGSALLAFPGRQTVTVSGGVAGLVPSESGEGFVQKESSSVFVAYGRTLDVMAWLEPGRHSKVSYDLGTESLHMLPRSGEAFLPDPRGSDLWFAEYSSEDELSFSLAGAGDITVLVMSDGQLPAPQTITLSWPGPKEAPWIVALIVLGVLSLVAGLGFAIAAWTHWRENQGPKRRRAKIIRRAPRLKPRRPQPRPPRRVSSIKPRGRRAAPFAALPLAGGLVLGLGACAAEIAPIEEIVLEAAPAIQAPNPAVTEFQFSTIMSRVAAQIQAADGELSDNLLVPRVADPTLSARRVSYIVTRADSQSGSLLAIPAAPVRLVVPQQTTGWPRSVFGVIQEEQDLESPSLGVILRQEDPRSNYKLTYAVVLNPQVQLPDLPSASVGAPKLNPDSKLTRLAPSELLAHYADVVNNGGASPFAEEFALTIDALYGQIGPDALALRQESFGQNVLIRWETTVTDREVVAFSSADGGAIVLGTLQQTERVEPVQSGAAVNSGIGIRALTSLSQSTEGFDVDSHVQVLWYVPAVGSSEGIRVLGYTYSLIASREVVNE
jgi:hypothetical protein